MRRNPLWIFFMASIALGTLCYTGYAAYKTWNYLRLDRQIPINAIQWSIIETSGEDFTPQASYHFEVDGNSYEGQSLWPQSYLNEWTAKEAISRLSKNTVEVWYDSSSPKFSSLAKTFPYKEGFSAVSLWIICLYFVCLDSYVTKWFSRQ